MIKNKNMSIIIKIVIALSCITIVPLLSVFFLFFVLSVIEDLYGTDYPDNL